MFPTYAPTGGIEPSVQWDKRLTVEHDTMSHSSPGILLSKMRKPMFTFFVKVWHYKMADIEKFLLGFFTTFGSARVSFGSICFFIYGSQFRLNYLNWFLEGMVDLDLIWSKQAEPWVQMFKSGYWYLYYLLCELYFPK